MKNTDHSFKLIAAVIIAGVIVAFTSPAHSTAPAVKATAVAPVTATASADLSQ